MSLYFCETYSTLPYTLLLICLLKRRRTAIVKSAEKPPKMAVFLINLVGVSLKDLWKSSNINGL